jgi:hypothetical protein
MKNTEIIESIEVICFCKASISKMILKFSINFEINYSKLHINQVQGGIIKLLWYRHLACTMCISLRLNMIYIIMSENLY